MNFKISSFVITLLISLSFQGCKSADSVAEDQTDLSLEIGEANKQVAINMFGQPQNKTVDEKGCEHWFYEFIPTEDSPPEAQWNKLELIYDGAILKDTRLTIKDGQPVGGAYGGQRLFSQPSLCSPAAHP